MKKTIFYEQASFCSCSPTTQFQPMVSRKNRSGFWQSLAAIIHALKPAAFFWFRRRKVKPDGTIDEIEFGGGGKA